MALRSYVGGSWVAPTGGDGTAMLDAVTGTEIGRLSTAGIDRAAALEYGRRVGGPALRALTFHQRAALLKALGSFLREHREETGCSAFEAAIAAGETRLRPVLMTAGAMFVGLIPMAIGIGEGSEQNAALARAVLGGVAFGTCATLILVPFLYALLRGGRFQPVEDYR